MKLSPNQDIHCYLPQSSTLGFFSDTTAPLFVFTNLNSVTMDWCCLILHFLVKCFFTQHYIRFCLQHQYINFHCCNIPLYACVTIYLLFMYLFVVDKHLGHFLFGAIMNYNCKNLIVCLLVFRYISFCKVYTWGKLTGSQGMFNFHKYCQSRSICNNLYSHWQCVRVQLLVILTNTSHHLKINKSGGCPMVLHEGFNMYFHDD